MLSVVHVNFLQVNIFKTTHDVEMKSVVCGNREKVFDFSTELYLLSRNNISQLRRHLLWHFLTMALPLYSR